MRRGRIFSGFIALVALAAFFMVVPSAFADGGTPMDICTDLQDGKLDGSYTGAQMQAFLSDPTVQGYCGPITVLTPPSTPPTTPPCTEVTPGTPGGGSPGTPGTPGSEKCTTPATPAPPTAPPTPTTPPTPATPATPAAQGTAPVVVTAVKGASHTVVTPARPTTGVQGAQHTVATPVAAKGVAPLATTKTTGTLPFTGAQLALFTLVGLALVATGLMLRTTARRDGRS